ncbi:MAG: BPSS1780 family membrane protein [Acidobacteriota bacterium]
MKLRLVPATQGLIWLRHGLLTCWHQSLGFLGLMGLITSVALLLMTVPLLGPLLFMGALPMVWMGFMLATRRVLAGQRITPVVLLEPWRGPDAPKKEWLQLGGAYIAAMILAMQLADWFGPGAEALSQANEQAKDVVALIRDPQVQADLLWRWALTLPVSLLFWHTPALVLWGRVPIGKALFFSLVASWRNLSAFVLYGLGWVGVAAVLGLLIRTIALLSPEPAIAEILAVILGMWTAGAFYASLYFTVVDCFESPESRVDQTV